MRTRIVPIGKSQGIRIPIPLLEAAGLLGEVDVCVEEGALVIRPARRPRAAWAAAFRKMAQHGDDALHDRPAPSLSAWDEAEWEW